MLTQYSTQQVKFKQQGPEGNTLSTHRTAVSIRSAVTKWEPKPMQLKGVQFVPGLAQKRVVN